jgi:hypothetical protein
MDASEATRHESIKPLVQIKVEVPNSDLVFSAACFEGKDWSLAPLQEPQDIDAHAEFAKRVGTALYGIGVRRAFAPKPSEFNGVVIDRRELYKMLPLNFPQGSVFLFRNRESPADGTSLDRAGDAGIFSAGGCGVIVATLFERMIFAHAGRDCLLDRKRVETNGKQQGRPYESVVDSIMLSFGPLRPFAKERLRVWPLFFIRPEDFYHRFDNKEHGEYNRGALKYVPRILGKRSLEIDKGGVRFVLPQIVKAQFMAHGVLEKNIFLEHSYLADELPTTRNGGGRYLTAVVRHS